MSKGDVRRVVWTLATFVALFMGSAASTNWRMT
jgi:hypothetical protein